MDRSVPGWLGRGVVVAPGTPVPPAWGGCDRVLVGQEEVESPAATVQLLHEAWLARLPVVVELAADQATLRSPETYGRPPYELDPGFEFFRERLQFLVWANNYDARSGETVWWHGRKAARRFAERGAVEGGPGDLLLEDGTPVFVDGGPAHPSPSPDGMAVVSRWNAEAGSMSPAGHSPPRAGLAADQLAAVAHERGPARVIAPAGSGKTRVLTERLRHLIVDRGVHPGTVTALAFNTKAADELRSRCADFVGPAGPHIRTLNSLGLWICNRLGGDGQLKVLEEMAVRDLIQQVFGVRRQSNTDTVVPYIDGLSAIRLGLLPPGTAEEEMTDAPGLAAGFDGYRRALAHAGAVDFDDQIYRAIEILLADPVARASAQERCRYLLVDEFQDLTPAHVLLIRLLCAPGYDCFGVGDDDQVIYGYAGADPKFLLQYGSFFPGAGEHALEVNYRCPPQVVDAAVHLLSYNKRRVPKEIRSAKQAGEGSLEVLRIPAEDMSGRAVALLGEWIDGGASPADMALLARVNSTLLPVQVACAEAGVPCSMPLGVEVLGRTGVRTALAYLRIGLDPAHISASDIRETIRRPSRGVAPMVVDMLTKARGSSLADVRRLAARLSGKDSPKLSAFADDLAFLAQVCGKSTSAQAVRWIRGGLGLDDTMDVLDSSRKEADRSTHTDDLIALESVAQLHPELRSFEAWLRSTLGRTPADGPLVLLSTVHRIKGREWPRVIVFGATTGLFPHRLSGDEEGERRVFHVAVTRSAAHLVVMAAEDTPSMFVAELDGSRPQVELAPAARWQPRPDRARGSKGARSGAASAPSTSTAGEARSAAGVAAEEALRSWRRSTSAREGVPSYVLLTDKELVGIAERRPLTLAALAKCPGIGPIRLERWGDEIVSILQGSAPGTAGESVGT